MDLEEKSPEERLNEAIAIAGSFAFVIGGLAGSFIGFVAIILWKGVFS